MALTAAELTRLENLEQDVKNLTHLVDGGGSKNQVNRLLVLAQEHTRELRILVESLETEMATLLTLARRLQ